MTNQEELDLAVAQTALVTEASVGLITAIILAAMARPEGLYVLTVNGLAEPIILDNGNAVYYFIPQLKRGFDLSDVGELLVRMAESQNYVEAGTPALEGPAAVTLFRDARETRTKAYKLLDEYLENTIELARPTPEKS